MDSWCSESRVVRFLGGPLECRYDRSYVAIVYLLLRLKKNFYAGFFLLFLAYDYPKI